MTDLALSTLREIRLSKCPMFVCHLFSNGGCFLWEKIRQILYHNANRIGTSYDDVTDSTKCDDESIRPIAALRDKLVGIVFDSSPCAFSEQPELLQNALGHCDIFTRLKLQLYLASRATLVMGGEKRELAARQRRAQDFWNGMRNCARPDIPQLYLYGDNDHLAPLEPLEELIEKRRREFGEEKIRSFKFGGMRPSPHCSHLLTYPEKYMEMLQSFLESCASPYCPLEH
eukprot:CAMPEP_0184869848 /NCGR_PEP_ID=MMETSP0580-20130426/35544_1 /TAXON_ID=1118495 /ORGANISM="Dactyliosolen fragilissimus" /LENGTH=228 /DNA_ID=CAMNT_0027371607 /DNA_START=271 /DNA_END=954 /DNA_ORIENTATION=+